MTRGRLATLACCVGACVLAGCVGETDPASNVRATQAQLNAHGHTNNGPARWWWEYGVTRSTVAGGGGTNPRQGPASSASDVNLNWVVRNLDTDQAYFFRACGQDTAAGSPVACGKVRELLTAPGDSSVQVNATFDYVRFDGRGETRHVLGVSHTADPTIMVVTDLVPIPQTDPPTGSALSAGAGCVSFPQARLGLMTTARCTDSSGITGFLAFLGPLDDVVSLSSSSAVGELHGGGGADDLTGGARDDAVYGDGGNDFLEGGPGADHLDGGPGLDVYDCDNDDDIVTDSVDEANQVRAAGCT